MKKMKLLLLAFVSFYGMSAGAMSASSSTPNSGAGTVTISENLFVKLVEKASSPKTAPPPQPASGTRTWSSCGWTVAKYAGYAGAATGAYWLAQRWLGLPTLAELRASITGHVTAMRRRLVTVFGAIRADVRGITNRTENAATRARQATAGVNDAQEQVDNLPDQTQTADSIEQKVQALENLARSLKDDETKLGTEVHKLIQAICQNETIRTQILQNIEQRLLELNNSDDEESRKTLEEIQQMIQEFSTSSVGPS